MTDLNVVHVDFDPMDSFAKLWLRLMGEITESPLSQAEKIGVIEFIKHEILTDMLREKSHD